MRPLRGALFRMHDKTRAFYQKTEMPHKQSPVGYFPLPPLLDGIRTSIAVGVLRKDVYRSLAPCTYLGHTAPLHLHVEGVGEFAVHVPLPEVIIVICHVQLRPIKVNTSAGSTVASTIE